MDLTCLVLAIVCIAAGCAFAGGRLHTRLRVWKAMGEAERRTIRIVPLCRNMGGMIALCGVLMLAAGLSSVFRQHAFNWCMLGWAVLCVIDVAFIQKSGRYVTGGKSE